MNSGVYTITNLVDGKMYIGYATDLLNRRDHHFYKLKLGNHDNEYLQRCYNKYGVENFIFEILWECPVEFLASEEHYWATLLNVHNRDYGYNIKPTHPYNEYRLSENSKQKIGIANSKRVHKISTLEKHKTILENRWKDLDYRDKMVSMNYKPILAYTLNGDFLKEFKSIKDAAIEYDTTSSSICRVLSGCRLSTRNIHFIYLTTEISNKITIRQRRR